MMPQCVTTPPSQGPGDTPSRQNPLPSMVILSAPITRPWPEETTRSSVNTKSDVISKVSAPITVLL